MFAQLGHRPRRCRQAGRGRPAPDRTSSCATGPSASCTRAIRRSGRPGTWLTSFEPGADLGQVLEQQDVLQVRVVITRARIRGDDRISAGGLPGLPGRGQREGVSRFHSRVRTRPGTGPASAWRAVHAGHAMAAVERPSSSIGMPAVVLMLMPEVAVVDQRSARCTCEAPLS